MWSASALCNLSATTSHHSLFTCTNITRASKFWNVKREGKRDGRWSKKVEEGGGNLKEVKWGLKEALCAIEEASMGAIKWWWIYLSLCVYMLNDRADGGKMRFTKQQQRNIQNDTESWKIDVEASWCRTGVLSLRSHLNSSNAVFFSWYPFFSLLLRNSHQRDFRNVSKGSNEGAKFHQLVSYWPKRDADIAVPMKAETND